MDKKQRDEQPPDPAVSIQERVDQLELSVNQGETDERRIPLVVGVWRRRHVGYPRNAGRGTCVLLVRCPPI